MKKTGKIKNQHNLLNLNQYDHYADIYSKDFLKYNQESIITYFRHFNFDLSRKKILDLGCGTGYDLSLIKKKGAAEIFGIDSSEEMVKIAQLNNPDGIIKLAHFEDIPFESNFFDIVISKWAIQTNYLIEPIYHEVIRILKSNGKFIFLACHPIRQFYEKKIQGKDYFNKELVKSSFFDGKIKVTETSHTFNEYLCPFFLENFILNSYEEGFDSAPEMINNDIYPSYFIINSTKR